MLNLDPELISKLLDKIRSVQAKEQLGSSTLNETNLPLSPVAIHENPNYQEALALIHDLREDQQATLLALRSLGQTAETYESWEEVFESSLEQLNRHTGEYLLTQPGVAEDIEAGLNTLSSQNRLRP